MPTFPRRSDEFKYELNLLALRKFTSCSPAVTTQLLTRICYQRTLTVSPVILAFLDDWERIVRGDTELLDLVFMSGSNYSLDMFECSPLLVLLTQVERGEFFG